MGTSSMDARVGDVASAQKRTVADLPGAVVESCTNGSTPLPRRLYTNEEEIRDAA